MGDGMSREEAQAAVMRIMGHTSRATSDRYVKLARDLEATGTPEPARAFMQSLCFSVLSSTESVFY